MRKARVVGEASVPNAVIGLLRKFDYPVIDPVIPVMPDSGGGGMMTVTVAAADASEISKSKADMQCSGAEDQDVINAAIFVCTNGGTVWLSEGTFICSLPDWWTQLAWPRLGGHLDRVRR
jgi:hypothetical protein